MKKFKSYLIIFLTVLLLATVIYFKNIVNNYEIEMINNTQSFAKLTEGIYRANLKIASEITVSKDLLSELKKKPKVITKTKIVLREVTYSQDVKAEVQEGIAKYKYVGVDHTANIEYNIATERFKYEFKLRPINIEVFGILDGKNKLAYYAEVYPKSVIVESINVTITKDWNTQNGFWKNIHPSFGFSFDSKFSVSAYLGLKFKKYGTFLTGDTENLRMGLFYEW